MRKSRYDPCDGEAGGLEVSSDSAQAAGKGSFSLFSPKIRPCRRVLILPGLLNNTGSFLRRKNQQNDESKTKQKKFPPHFSAEQKNNRALLLQEKKKKKKAHTSPPPPPPGKLRNR